MTKDALAQIHILQDLPPEQRIALAGDCTWRNFAARQVILEKQDASRDFFLVTEGKVLVTNYSLTGKEISFQEVGAGDYVGELSAIETVVDSGLEVYAQNLETVRRLTHPVRDPRAGYEQTLDVLEHAKRHRPDVLTKTSLMLGLGETDAEIRETLGELRARKVDIVTFGQYLRPTKNHLPVERFVTPEEFAEYRRVGLDMGFMEVVSGPLVRSSYRADRVFEQNNVGL